MGATADAERSRNRILAMLALQLPVLRGTPKQVAWAVDIRQRRIGLALTVTPGPDGELTYHLMSQRAFDVLGLMLLSRVYGKERVTLRPETEQAALTSLVTAVTSPGRDDAVWWIDNRSSANAALTPQEWQLLEEHRARRRAVRAAAKAKTQEGRA